MIIAQYGKKILWCLRKWVLHNLSIGSTLPNTKNFFLAMCCLMEMTETMGKKNELPTMWTSSICKYSHTHSKAAHLMSCFCALYVFKFCRFRSSKHRHQPLTRLLSCCKDTIFSRMDNHLSKKKSYLQTKNEFLSLLEAQNEQCNVLQPYHGDEHYD
jgi:hypothetical protein